MPFLHRAALTTLSQFPSVFSPTGKKKKKQEKNGRAVTGQGSLTGGGDRCPSRPRRSPLPGQFPAPGAPRAVRTPGPARPGAGSRGQVQRPAALPGRPSHFQPGRATAPGPAAGGGRGERGHGRRGGGGSDTPARGRPPGTRS